MQDKLHEMSSPIFLERKYGKRNISKYHLLNFYLPSILSVEGISPLRLCYIVLTYLTWAREITCKLIPIAIRFIVQLSVFVEIICQPVQFLVHFARISKLTMQDIHVKCSINMKYRIPHNYSTYAYKGTVKQFRGFQVTACVYIYLLLYKSICCGYSHNICVYLGKAIQMSTRWPQWFS